MPPKRVDWLKDIPQQRTVIRRTPAPAPTPMQQSMPMGYTYPMQAAPTMQPAGTFTGAGVDGMVQPGKYAGMVHEGEAVIPANAAQAIPPHIFKALVDQAASGTLDVNALGTVLKQPPMQGYQTGTYSAGLENPYPTGVGAVTKVVPSGTIQTSSPTPTPKNQVRSAGVPSNPAAQPANTGNSITQLAPTVKAPAPIAFKPAEIKVDLPKTAFAPTIAAQAAPVQTAPAELMVSDNGRAAGYGAACAPTTQQVDSSFADRSAGYAAAGTPTTQQVDSAFAANADRAAQYAAAGTPNTAQVDASFQPAPTVTPSATTTTPAATTATSTAASNIVRKGLQNLSKQMDGMSDTDRRIANFYLSNTDATNAANLRVLASQISADPYMSPQAKQNAIAGLQRDMAADRGTMAGTLAIDAAQRADAAQAQGIQLGQQVRTFEDITLPTSQQANELARRTFEEVTLPTTQANLKTLEENLRQATETYNNYTTPANKIALEAAQSALDNAKTVQSNTAIQNRISTLFASGSVSTAKNDPTLQALVKTMLGANATPEQISDEIGKQWAAFNETKKADFNNNAEVLIGAAIDNELDLATVLSDDSIRRTVAGANGLDINDPNDKAKIDEKIRGLYNQLDLSEAEILYNRLVKTGFVDEYMNDSPDFKQDMLAVISDLALKGSIDPETGMPSQDSWIELPWNDPDTRFKYKDWDGNDIDVGTPVDSVAIGILGNGTDYKNSNGQAVTNGDATAKWNSLGSTEKNKFLNDDGSVNVEAFLAAKFPATKTEDGQTVPVVTPETYDDKFLSSESYRNAISDAMKGFVSQAQVPTELTRDNGGMYEAGMVPTTMFLSYDEYGKPQIKGFQEGNLGFIWQQLSDKYGKPSGTLLDAASFQKVWNEGKDWRVNSDGVITNLNTPGVDPKFDAAVNNYRAMMQNKPYSVSDDFAKSLSAQYASLPSDIKASGDHFLENNQTVTRTTDGSNRWVTTGDINRWVEQNKGRLYSGGDGRLYVVGGISNKTNFNDTNYVYLYDYLTGEKVAYTTGGGSTSKLNGAPYA